MFLDVLAKSAKEKCGLRPDAPILVGVSGGADSLALMVGFQDLGFEVIVAHLDHSLRSESIQDADFVETLAENRGLAFVRERVDVQAEANSLGQSIEEAARNVRYQFLFQQAKRFNAQAVAVGHHADDQIETVLMHFLRGAALPGLTGMSYRSILPIWHSHIPLVRPLLDIWRDEIDDYVAALGISPRVDKSNQDTTYFRNRLRHDLIPELETYNPRFREVILRMADVLREEDRFLEDRADFAWTECFRTQTLERVELNLPRLLALSKAMQRRVLRRAIALLRPDLRNIGFEAVERGLDFAAEPPESGEIDLVARLNLVLIRDVLIIKTWNAELPDWEKPLLPQEGLEVILDLDHPISLLHDWRLVAERLSKVPPDRPDFWKNIPRGEAWFDAEKLKFPLVVRARRTGDRWQPLGISDHTQAVHDFLINQKIPAHMRDRWPLVWSGGEIAWVVGLRPSDVFKITDRTERVVRLRLTKDNSPDQ